MEKNKSFLQVVWDILFALFYPIITIFSLIFMGIVYFLSSISRFISYILPKSKSVEDK